MNLLMQPCFACPLEQTLAIKWEAEQEEMRRRRDPRKVMCISDTRRLSELHFVLANLPQGVDPDAASERHLLLILKDLPPDRAWWVSSCPLSGCPISKVAAPPSECRLDQDIETAVPIPDAVRRAAARAGSYYAESEK